MEITMVDVSKSFNKKKVLDTISLTMDEKNITCLLGPSGSGKTTLIRLILGSIPADKGSIKIDGTAMPHRQLLNTIGFMPQQDALYNDLSGLDNLKFFGSLQGLKGKKLKDRINDVLTLVDLHDDAKKIVLNYSGGMKKRLSLGIALLHEPKILLLDEPTVGIDPILRKKIWQQFSILKEAGVTLVITTHIMEEAQLCEYAALIYGGRLIEKGYLGDLLRKSPDGSLEGLFLIEKEMR